MWMQIVSLITAAFDLRLNGLGIFVELLLQLQQFKAASLARFPTTPQKRALPRVGHPLRAGLFSKWLAGRYQSVCRRFLKSAGKDRSSCRAGKTFISYRQQSLIIHLPCSAGPRV